MASFGEYTPIDNQNGLLNFQDYGLKAAQTETAQQNLADRATLRAQAEGFASSDPAEVARARGVALSVPVGVNSAAGVSGMHEDQRAQLNHGLSVTGGLAQAILLAPADQRAALYEQYLPIIDQLGMKVPRQYPGDVAVTGFRDAALDVGKRLDLMQRLQENSTGGPPRDPLGITGPGGAVGPGGMAGPRSSLNLGQDQIANGKAIYNGLVSRGMDSETALAMAANGLGESGGNWATQPGDGGASHGIFQWNKDRLAAFQGANGGKLPGQTSLDAQLDFAMKEWRADHNGAASAAGKLPSAEQKIRPIVSQYEVSANQPTDIQKRTAYLNQLRQAGVGSAGASPQAGALPAPVRVAGPGAPTQSLAPSVDENNLLPSPPPRPPEADLGGDAGTATYRSPEVASATLGAGFPEPPAPAAVAAPAPPPIANPNPLLGAGGPAPEPRQNTFMPAASVAPPASTPTAPVAPAPAAVPPLGGQGMNLRRNLVNQLPVEHPIMGKGYGIDAATGAPVRLGPPKLKQEMVGGKLINIDEDTGREYGPRIDVPDARRVTSADVGPNHVVYNADGKILSSTPIGEYKIAEKSYARDEKDIAGIASDGHAAQTDNVRLQLMRAALDDPAMKTGSGGAWRAAVSAWVETYLPDQFAAFAKRAGNLPDGALAQEFSKLASKGAFTQERQTLGARGGYQAIKLFQQINPGLELLPGANKAILGTQLIGNQADSDYSQAAQAWFTSQEDRFGKDAKYTSLAHFDQQWQEQRNPQVYAAAMGALAGVPFEKWTRGLTPEEGRRAAEIVARADPNAQIAGRGGMLPASSFLPKPQPTVH